METTAETVPRAVARLEALHDYDVPKMDRGWQTEA